MTLNISSKTPTSALHEILSWSLGRPDWQRDALRRIVENGNLLMSDIPELNRICRAKHQIDTNSSPVIEHSPLAQAHLPPAPGTSEAISLVSIGKCNYVNRLPSDQTIPLGTEIGITVIYGENGAGKTSYARVIKKACRARGAQPIIRPNAFSSTASPTATAEIIFKIGGTDTLANWTDGVSADPRLANVFVFDSISAGHYVSEDSAAAFTPYGLDLLPTLSRACDAIDEQLKKDILQMQTLIAAVAANWKYESYTQVGKLLKNLSASSKESNIDDHAGLNAQQTKRLQDLREALKADPLQKAKETRAVVARLESFRKCVVSVSVALEEDKVVALKHLLDNAKNTEITAKAFALGKFNSDYLTGTGSELWRSLWDAAQAYSISEAYKDQEFPVTADEAQCLLCQQKLDGEAVKRLSIFEGFAKDASQQLAKDADKHLIEAENKLSLIVAIGPELEKINADISGLTTEQTSLISEFSIKVDERLIATKQSLLNRLWIAPPSMLISPEVVINELKVALEARAVTEESADDPETRKTLIAECSELEAREWLSSIKAAVVAQIETYKVIEKLVLCQKDVATAQITTKSSELTKQFVTDAFQKRFKDELKVLGLKTLDVALEPIKGKKGETKFGLRFIAASSQKVVDVASEGEQRCIALAAFLSELSQASHQSALVFDDPVSSLDHWHREKIAERLVEESKKRQVIVFTHDVVFLNDLLAFAEKIAMTPNVLTLEWNDGAPGRYVEGLPWDSKKPLDCLNDLEQSQKTISTKWNPQPNGANIEDMRHAYSRLRSTVERIVEVELLDGIVCRFESQINAGRVKKLIGIPPSECEEIKRLLQVCHDITDAHAPSKATIPDPNQLLQDISSARQLITTIRSRKKLIQ